MSIIALVEKIDVRSKTRNMVEEPVAIEAPVNIFLNYNYVITLLATPKFQKELALGWLFDEGILTSLEEVEQVLVQTPQPKHLALSNTISPSSIRRALN